MDRGRLLRRLAAVGIAAAGTFGGCVGAGTAPTSTPAAATATPAPPVTPAPPSASPSPSPSTPGPSPRELTIELTDTSENQATLTVVDRLGLVEAVAPGVPRPPPEPTRPAVWNPDEDPSALLVVWGQLACRTATTMYVEGLDEGALVTIRPAGSRDCDLVGGIYAVRLLLSRPMPAADVAARQVGELSGAIYWTARSPTHEGFDVEVVDRAWAMVDAVFDIPPRLAPGPAGIAAANPPGRPREVMLAWSEPCGYSERIVVEEAARSLVVRVELLVVNPCPGAATTRGVTLTFLRDVPAAGLRLELGPGI